MQSLLYFFLILSALDDSCDLFTHILHGCLTGTGAIILRYDYPVRQPWIMVKIDHYQTTSKWNHIHEFCHVLYDIVTALAGTWETY